MVNVEDLLFHFGPARFASFAIVGIEDLVAELQPSRVRELLLI